MLQRLSLRLPLTIFQFDTFDKQVISKFFVRTMTSIKDSLFATYSESPPSQPTNKVTIVGAGSVGMATAICLLAQGVTNNLVLIDKNDDLVKGEIMDFQHGSTFLKNPHISGGSDVSLSKDSKVCVVTAGVRQQEGESRLSLVQRNADVMKVIIPNLLKHSPNTILLMVSNPVDIMTYVAWKISGLPKHKVIGSGTNLDTARFRVLLSQKLGVNPTNCHGYIIGEHGDNSVPVWSTTEIAGVRLRDIKPDAATPRDPEKLGDLHKGVVESAYDIIKLKGYTSWAIALSISQLVQAILTDASTVHCVTVSVKGHHGVNDEIFMSLPAVLKGSGVNTIVKLKLNEEETEKFRKTATLLKEIADGVKLCRSTCC